MSTVHHPVRPVLRPARCLRHHVWMAACSDCRDAHTAPVRDLRETGPASR
ncbi:hypothetical protein SAMN05660209_00960 [Geodermatophilus africanus]|uniref:Uncharacterized protein n=1 Tax=Geodermatophilus africanus TaxID=1137993 RepID=A0A1H3DGE0_9ACTN|nr:hypothetical protein [Geodermatophilus africanus]SDX64759.1 hypothetical protein SAMN05660209_00960 [Geodermatophilus africanus]